MTSNRRFRLCYGLAIGAIVCSAASLFLLIELSGSRWTTPLDVLALMLVLLGLRLRPPVRDR